ncbi:leucine-rich repeat-containing protein 36 isoform X3 [Hemicordylus capensis]|uniref:leucine-rich repeat-containing protein 36 isoform X3 n=1 Tax=Hemicordylus capensis TaxID=884348 RepID=UPI00230469B5|nr:leucine-rich repeat-containing protein 36 isoform X3 [Hemicordylus capensis]
MAELALSEAWVRRQPALRGLPPEQVESLSLQGTYAGKIVSLGDGLKSFKNLRSLDLSKNLLLSLALYHTAGPAPPVIDYSPEIFFTCSPAKQGVSHPLPGLEQLHALEHLNLYYNRISSLLEVARLQALPRLRELDLRLNPITRKESDYRLFTMCRLRTLDDRTIRDSERKAALLHFSLKQSKGASWEKEKSSESAMGNPMLDQEGFAMPSLDMEGSRTQADLSGLGRVPYRDGRDAIRTSKSAFGLQTSKATRGSRELGLQTQQAPLDDSKARLFLSHNPLDNEPLSSASQAQPSLRSQVRSRASPGKGRCRVSFSEGPSLDFSAGERETGRKLDLLDLGRDVSPARRLHLNDSGKSSRPYEFAHRDLRTESCENLYLPYSTHYRELLKRLHQERKAADEVCSYTSRLANDALASTQSSCGDFLGQPLEAEADYAEALKLRSDAKLGSPFLPFTHPASANLGDFPPKHQPPTKVLLENVQPVSTLTSASWKERDPPSCRSLSPSRLDFNHPLGAPKHCFREPSAEQRAREQSSLQSRTHSPSGPERGSPVIVVLRQLLELVDRYWEGSGSLLLNKDFLAPARDLLAHLMAPGPKAAETPCKSHRDPPQCPQHLNGIASPGKLEGGQAPSFKDQGVEAAATSKQGPHGVYALSYDELLQRNEQLNTQMELLSSELKQLKKQQETLSLLRESQRSLVSTNNFLLQQLNKDLGPPGTSSSPPSCPRSSHHPAPSSALGWSPLCPSEQLRSCPL